MSTYVPAGDIPLGSLSQAEPSAKELTRRAKMATDATWICCPQTVRANNALQGRPLSRRPWARALSRPDGEV